MDRKEFLATQPRIHSHDAKKGDFIFANDWTVFELCRSGDLPMKTLSPDALVMRVFIPGHSWKEGQITIDYFNAEFYGPFTFDTLNTFLDTLIACEK